MFPYTPFYVLAECSRQQVSGSLDAIITGNESSFHSKQVHTHLCFKQILIPIASCSTGLMAVLSPARRGHRRKVEEEARAGKR